MNVLIRADSSSSIGTGHLMRCLTLADGFRETETSVAFVCRELPGNINDMVVKRGYRLLVVPTGRDLPPSGGGRQSQSSPLEKDFREYDALHTRAVIASEGKFDWLIVDHYGLDERWERAMRDRAVHIMVIDDLARNHDCDLLLDQNYHENQETLYAALTPPYCRLLLGPTHALLRPEFAEARKNIRERDGIIRRILIFMGGADQHNVTEIALGAIRIVGRADITVDVVVGAANPHGERIEAACRSLLNCTCHHRVGDMAELMGAADLAIGAPGSTTWERCCLGLPTLFVATAANEVDLGRQADKLGIGKFLGICHEASSEMLAKELKAALESPLTVREWGSKATLLVDGGGVDRVCRAIHQLSVAEVAS